MRVLVCGSRDWEDRRVIAERLGTLERGATIIHGGARGADLTAGHYARALGLSVEEHRADWKRHGRRAGPIRNLGMLDSGVALVLAFQRNGSRGTQHTIDEARRRGIPVEVYTS